MNKKDPTKEELESIVLDKCDSIQSALDREGFKRRIPRADWSNFQQSLIIITKDQTNEINDAQLQKILDDEETVPEEDMAVIKEWYAISSYRYGHEMKKCETGFRDAVHKGDTKQRDEYKKRMNELLKERRSIPHDEFIKRQLAYTFQETGERLDKLYDIMYGEIETVKANFGLIELSITKNCYDKKIEEKEYQESKGFFEDIKNAFEIARSLHAPLEYSSKAGAVFSYEWVGGKGIGLIDINGTPVGLTANLEKDGMKNKLYCSIKTLIDSNKKKLTEKVNLFLPEFTITEEPLWYAEKEGFRVGYLEKDSSLMFGGDLYKLEEEIKRFLEAVLE